MYKWERKLVDLVLDHMDLLFFLAISVIAFGIRLSAFSFLSGDMKKYLIPWFQQIQSLGGIPALKETVGNYNLLYQTLICLMSYLPINCVWQYKLLSVFFDYLLAGACGYVVCRWKKQSLFGRTFLMVYTTVLLLPTVVLNSAFWGQCDSIFTFFVVLSLAFLLDERYVPAFVLLGIGFAFKFQTIFFLPLFFIVYFSRRSFTLFHFLLTPAAFFATGIPAFLVGRSPLDMIRIYSGQTVRYKKMYMGLASFWGIVKGKYEDLHLYAVLITLALCGVMLYLVLSGFLRIETTEQFLCCAAWLVWVDMLFLPAMHERYPYPLEILLLLLCFLHLRYLPALAVALNSSFISYSSYLFKTEGYKGPYYYIVYTAAFLFFSWQAFRVMHPAQDAPAAAVQEARIEEPVPVQAETSTESQS